MDLVWNGVQPNEETAVAPGELWWVRPDATVGREQAGRRPALVISSQSFHEAATTLAIIVPLTFVDRRWPNHVKVEAEGVAALGESWAMTEQVRTVLRRRLDTYIGRVSPRYLAEVREWVANHIDAFQLDEPEPPARR